MSSSSSSLSASDIQPQALSSLFTSLNQAWIRATSSGTVVRPSSTLVLLPDGRRAPSEAGDGAGEVGKLGVNWRIRCVPSLGQKARAKAQAQAQAQAEGASSAASTTVESDVFAPPYDANLFVWSDESHVVLLNKYALVARHFLLVPKQFASQNLPPTPGMLALSYQILRQDAQSHTMLSSHFPSTSTSTCTLTPEESEREEDGELFAFYNCGHLSGASQRRSHVQFLRSGLEGQEELGERGEGRVPIERLLSLCVEEHQGKDDTVFALPLPYQHFVALLTPPSSSQSGALQSYLMRKLFGLLEAMQQARFATLDQQISSSNATFSPSQSGATQNGPPSYNLLMTTRAMHLIPRSKEVFELKVEEDGKEHQAELSINSMAYAGHLLAKNRAELLALQSLPGGALQVLSSTGIAGVKDVTTALAEEGTLATKEINDGRDLARGGGNV
ncbi:APA1_2 [Ceraceosorus bombacis]|uniref:APA1_2 n=1 Tax=Ceraceosorus bombacis TaxID=401625 RepID=A0A0P1BJ64_9BASI|nr:APA1_2 [Ceraceosorus bombacis]